jgi:hypothetical protein
MIRPDAPTSSGFAGAAPQPPTIWLVGACRGTLIPAYDMVHSSQYAQQSTGSSIKTHAQTNVNTMEMTTVRFVVPTGEFACAKLANDGVFPCCLS